MKAKHVTAQPKARVSRPGGEHDPEVEEFLGALEHPLKKELQSLRKLILEASPAIREGFKWHSPSFRTGDYFATINVRGAGRPPRPEDPPSLCLVLHTGAKKRAGKGPKVKDPAQLLEWVAKDRCLVSISSAKELREKRAGLQAVVRQWIEAL